MSIKKYGRNLYICIAGAAGSAILTGIMFESALIGAAAAVGGFAITRAVQLLFSE